MKTKGYLQTSCSGSEHFATLYGERAQEIAGELALHFEQGRDYWRAILYRQQAGEQALQQSAYHKALGHGRAGVALLMQLPTTAEREQLGLMELRLRQLVNSGLAVTRGFADDELEDSLHRAQQLCRELADEAALVPGMIALARLQLFRANRPALEELAQQEWRLTERLHDPLLLVQLQTHLVSIELVRGRYTRAEEHYQHVARHYNAHAHRSSPSFFAEDPLIVALTSSGLSLSLAGWLDHGWSRIAQGLARAEEGAQYLVLANGLWVAVVVKSLRGEYEEAGQLAQKMSALTREHDFSLYASLGVLLQGGMAVQGGALQEGMAALISGLAQYRALGVQLFVPYFLSCLADGYRHQGKGAEALQVVSEALSLTATNFDVFWEAELYRQKGELLLTADSMADGNEVRPERNEEQTTKCKSQDLI
jgi:tetratricopeptide (TPR) repeat protein